MGPVEGKITIIRGAGSESAELFAGEGAPVVIADIDRAGGKTAADRIRAAGGAALFVPTDVAIAKQVEALVEGTAGRPEWIDVFFNNAGILISSGPERRAHERHPPRTSRFG